MPNKVSYGRIFLIAAAIIIVLVIAALTNPSRSDITVVEKLTQDIMAPVKSVITFVYDKIRSLPLYLGDINKTIDENEALKREILGLRQEMDKYEAAYKEGIRLRALLGIADDMTEWIPVAAKIIGRDGSSWYSTVTIRGGEDKGFEKNMPVINADGLVGRIQSVSQYTSEILLLTDYGGAMGALIQTSRTPGVIESVDSRNVVLQLIHIPADVDIELGQVIVTSGLGGVFPMGLRIGYISEVSTVDGGLMQQAYVKPFVDFNRLEEVMVLTHIPAIEEDVLDEEETVMPTTESPLPPSDE